MMIRRRVVALISALLMLGLAGAIMGSFALATQGEGGREWIRRALTAQLARAVNGHVYVGTLSGSFLTELRIDSLRIADRDDSTFFASGPMVMTYDPRDLADGRIILRSLRVERPYMAMRQDLDRRWTSAKLWPSRGDARDRGALRRTALGSVLVVEQLHADSGQFVLMMPVGPTSSGDVQRVKDGFVKTWRWQDIVADIPRLRLRYPDSVGTHITIARLDVNETEPPFAFRNLVGEVTIRNDTVALDVPHFDLPNSNGSALGHIRWRRRQYPRYEIHVSSDRVALSDIAWIDASIPTEGAGTTELVIHNLGDDPHVASYAIRAMDVRSHRSRVRGRMTWDVGGDEVALRDVDLEALPVDVALLEAFNGGPFDVPLKGQLTGRVRGSGGPLSRFRVDDLTARFVDGNVQGAIARGRLQGELDISDIANATFRGTDVTLETFDLRTAQALSADFPRLNGIVSGTAILDSSWLDVRLRDADVWHRDGDGPLSNLKGSARLDWAREVVRWELDAVASPVSFTTLAQSYAGFPLRGEYAGPLRTRGSLDALSLIASLAGPAGQLDVDATMDAEAPQYRVTGTGRFVDLSPRVLLDRPRWPEASLTGSTDVDVSGDSLATLLGRAAVTVERSMVSGARVFAGTTRVRFADRRAYVDTLALESTPVDVAGRGALGLAEGVSDSLDLRFRMDSLGGLRPWLHRAVADSMSGNATVTAQVIGWARGFDVDATLGASNLFYLGNGARTLSARAHLTGLPTMAAGEVNLFGDTLQLARFGMDALQVRALRDGSVNTGLRIAAVGHAGTTLDAGGILIQGGNGNDSMHVRLDSLVLNTTQRQWRLAQPATVALAHGGVAVDSFALRTADGSSVIAAGQFAARDALDLRVTGRAVPMADLSELLQWTETPEGQVDLTTHLTGTRSAPHLVAEGEWRNGLINGVRLDTLRARATATAAETNLRLALGSRARPALTAEGVVPLRLLLDSVGPSILSSGPVRGRLQADSLSIGIFEQLTQSVSGTGPQGGAHGTIALALDVAGSWARPSLRGTLNMRNGRLSPAMLGDVRWRNVEADIGFHGDSISLDRVVAQSGAGGSGRAQVAGWMRLVEPSNPTMDLRLTTRGFHAFARPNVADVDLSGELRLSGAYRTARLRGALTADRAIISIPEVARKDVIALEDLDPFANLDTASLLDSRALPSSPPVFVENLSIENVAIQMGRDVWLRSSEANINLGGDVRVTRGQVTRGRDAGQLQFALDGPLQTVRGTYRLNLGPVQRTFEVEQGEIRFYGDPDNNPTLSIDALHTVRQYSAQGARPDVRVRVHLGGTLLQPTAQLSTPDSVRVTNSDLISYLVTGGPSYEIGSTNRDISSTALSVVLGSFGSVLGGKAAGGVCDDANVTTAGLEQYGGAVRDVSAGVLSGIRINCARQVGDKAFVRLDAGLCQVGQLMARNSGGDPLSFTDALGLKLDYLLSPGFSASFGVEPSTSAVLCSVNANASARGFVPTPRQVGLDLFRTWRF